MIIVHTIQGIHLKTANDASDDYTIESQIMEIRSDTHKVCKLHERYVCVKENPINLKQTSIVACMPKETARKVHLYMQRNVMMVCGE